eukprot:NODE_113_length_19319_cov_0.247815.p2 type:complete len:633 gc:universal NODE_113_length_19319_cov_0.247815:16824-18722(+)
MNFPSFTFKPPNIIYKPKKKSTKLFYIDKTANCSPSKNNLKYELLCTQSLGSPINKLKAAKAIRYYQVKLKDPVFVLRQYEELLSIQPIEVELSDIRFFNSELQFLHQHALTDPRWFMFYAFHPKNKRSPVMIMNKAIEAEANQKNWQLYLFALQLCSDDAEYIHLKFAESFMIHSSVELVLQYFNCILCRFDMFSFYAITDAFRLVNNSILTINYLCLLQFMEFNERALVLAISIYVYSSSTLEDVAKLFEDDLIVWDELRGYRNVPLKIKTFSSNDPERIVLFDDIRDLLFRFDVEQATDILVTYLGSFGMDIFYLPMCLEVCGIPSDFTNYNFDKDYAKCSISVPLPSKNINYLGPWSTFISNYNAKPTGIPVIPFLHFYSTTDVGFRFEIINHYKIFNDLQIHDLIHINELEIKELLSRDLNFTNWFYYIWHLLKFGRFNQARKLYNAYLKQRKDQHIFIVSIAIELYIFKNFDYYNINKLETQRIIASHTYATHYWIALIMYGMVRLQLLQPQECLHRFTSLVIKYPISDVWLLMHNLSKEYVLCDFVATPFDDHWIVELIKSYVNNQPPRYQKNPYIIHLRDFYNLKDNRYQQMSDLPYDAQVLSTELLEERGFRIRPSGSLEENN